MIGKNGGRQRTALYFHRGNYGQRNRKRAFAEAAYVVYDRYLFLFVVQNIFPLDFRFKTVYNYFGDIKIVRIGVFYITR